MVKFTRLTPDTHTTVQMEPVQKGTESTAHIAKRKPRCFGQSSLRGGRTKQVQAVAVQTVGAYTALIYWMVRKHSEPYLSTILDACTKQVLSYVLSESFQVDFVLKTVEQLVENHGISLTKETIIHSDQGAQYTSVKFINLVKDSRLRQSMSHRGCCWDNAPQESFYGHMKDKLGDVIPTWQNFEDVKKAIDDWIDYYNNDRYQWDLAKLSPNEYYEYITTGVYPETMIRQKSGSN